MPVPPGRNEGSEGGPGARRSSGRQTRCRRKSRVSGSERRSRGRRIVQRGDHTGDGAEGGGGAGARAIGEAGDGGSTLRSAIRESLTLHTYFLVLRPTLGPQLSVAVPLTQAPAARHFYRLASRRHAAWLSTSP